MPYCSDSLVSNSARKEKSARYWFVFFWNKINQRIHNYSENLTGAVPLCRALDSTLQMPQRTHGATHSRVGPLRAQGRVPGPPARPAPSPKFQLLLLHSYLKFRGISQQPSFIIIIAIVIIIIISGLWPAAPHAMTVRWWLQSPRRPLLSHLMGKGGCCVETVRGLHVAWVSSQHDEQNQRGSVPREIQVEAGSPSVT